MNEWSIAAAVLLGGTAPSVVVVLRGSVMDRLVSLQITSIAVTLSLVALAQAFGSSFYFDVALVTAAISMFSNLVYVRLVERWL